MHMEKLRDMMMDSIAPFHKKRSRYESGGKGVPSVTEILGYIDNQGLIDWANAIGRRGQNNKDVAAKAARYGTATHSAIENYLKEGYDTGFLDNSSFKAFLKWWNGINSCHKVVILGQEEALVTELFAGTYDLLVSIDGKIYMIDFKTSNHVNYKYFMQLAAYRYLIYRLKGISIDGVIILQLGKGPNAGFTEFPLDFNIPDHYNFIENCMNAFVGALYTYHNAEPLKDQFKDVFYELNKK